MVVGRNLDPKIVAKNFIGDWGGGEAGIAVGRGEETIEVPNEITDTALLNQL